MVLRRLLIAVAAVISIAPAVPAFAGTASLNLVLVMDGLRPDSITPEDTPNLFKLRNEGVNFINSHSVFPTVTRVNATAIGTGVYPSRNGIFGNSLYVRAVDPNRSFGNDDHRNLLKLDSVTNGGMVLSKTLGEILAEHGKTLAAVSSADTAGSTLLANPRAPKGVGVLVNGYWEKGVRVAFPDRVNAAILSRFGAAPPEVGGREGSLAQVTWAQRVMREYVLPEVKPDVIINWFTEPDHIQHAMGAGSPEARAMIRNDDREVGLLLERLRALGLEGKTNIIVVSDHGFGANDFGVDLQGELIKAKLKAAADSDDVVLAPSGQAVALHARNHDAAKIGAIVRFLQAQTWTGVIFTAAKPGGSGVPAEGREPGTFSLELIHLAHTERGPDIVLTFPWSSDKNAFGVPGKMTTIAAATGPARGNAAGHGAMSPWTVTNTFFAWGADFKRGITVRAPASNVDVTPTLIALMNLDKEVPLSAFDGRALSEAFAGGPDPEQVPVQVRTYVTETADRRYRAALQVTEVAQQRYIDKSWRVQ